MGNDGAFESRLSIMRKVLEAIKDKRTHVTGICGMGGIGKKTMANEVAKLAIKEGLIDEVVQVATSYSEDEKNLQDRIAEVLGLQLQGHDASERAFRLRERMNAKGTRILLILTDLWTPVDLTEVGIPLGSYCKILVTSRAEHVLCHMSANKVFRVDLLSMEEAWILFQRELKIEIHPNDELYGMARKIVDKCGRLPLTITTCARALANKTKVEWMHVFERITQDMEIELDCFGALFVSLEVSYDSLETEETKVFFLLCCLFQVDSIIYIENMVRYAVGLRLFQRVVTLQEARDVAYSCVHAAKKLNLLLGTDDKERVKMHGIVEEFGRRVASRDNRWFMVEDYGRLRDDTHNGAVALSLHCERTDELSNGLNCPNLKLLQIVSRSGHSLEVPERLCEAMRELKVLDLRKTYICGSLHMPTNLRTLCLDYCTLPEDLSFIGSLQKLEIVSCAYSNIRELLPNTIGSLNELKLLDLTECRELYKVSPGVFPSLIHLEELYVRGAPIHWAEEDHDGETNASFAELKSLSKLVAIEIDVPYGVLPIAGKNRGFFRKGRKVYN